MPLLAEVSIEAKSRFLGCEGLAPLTREESGPLLLAVSMGSVVVGLPSHTAWDKDRVSVRFQELQPDESLRDASSKVDNLTRRAHADPIFQRHRDRIVEGIDAQSLWARRRRAFPSLSFGLGVEADLVGQANHLDTSINKLIDLDRAAADWREGAAPEWRTKVTQESPSVLNKPGLSRQRRFRSQDGTTCLFAWHARVGSSVRIHLRFDASTREVEIGYIGPHLPLP